MNKTDEIKTKQKYCDLFMGRLREPAEGAEAARDYPEQDSRA